MKFKGDIIITDPCYIIKNNHKVMPKEYEETKPKQEDFLSHIDTVLYPDAKKVSAEILKEKGDFYDYNLYSSYRSRKAELLLNSMINDIDEEKYKPTIDKIDEAMDLCLYVSETKNKEVELYEEALFEWEKPYMDDRDICDYGYEMESLGFTTYLSSDTRYGDWSCTTYCSDTKETLGKFCADGGMVGVYLLDEVLKYNPNFDYHTERLWTTTLIKDFDGDIEIKYFDDVDEVRVIGNGNVNFITTQTGL